MIERVRRVVMGEPEPQKSAFTHIEEVEPLISNGGGGTFADSDGITLKS
jgi:hypothetical protein